MTPILAASAAGCGCAGYQKRPGDPGDDGPPPDPCGDDGCDCSEDPTGFGCPCDSLEPGTCFDGDAALAGIGQCVPGLRSCVDGAWGYCEGEVVATEEVCDEIDNDCDGTVDDGVLSDCGDCNEDCRLVTYGDGDGEIPFDPDSSNSTGVEAREDGALVLAGDTYELHVIWIPNSPQGTISKIDTESREEQARYRTGASPTLDSPSRTSLDYRGNAFVANRAFGAQGSVTKIWERDCYDEDGNGRIDTSAEPSDVLEWGTDECVAWHTDVGAWNALARSLAVQTRVDAGGEAQDYVWAGLYAEHRYVELDADTGELTGREANVEPCSPYGAAIDRDGNLWSACLSQYVARFDTADTDDVEVLRMPSGYNYGITVDEDGFVWTGGSCTRYDPVAEEWTSIAGCGGTGVATDGHGSIWVGACWGAGIGGGTCRIDAETLTVTNVAAQSYGVGVDFDGMLWGIPQSGYVDLIDPGDAAGEEVVTRILNDCGGATGACLTGPYTYSDMSGFQLQNATNPEGYWETVVEGCETGETRWVSILWDAETPPDTSVRFEVRGADSLFELLTRPWTRAASGPADTPPQDLAAALGGDAGAHYVGVRATLATARHGSTPVLHSVSLQRSCPDGFR